MWSAVGWWWRIRAKEIQRKSKKIKEKNMRRLYVVKYFTGHCIKRNVPTQSVPYIRYPLIYLNKTNHMSMTRYFLLLCFHLMIKLTSPSCLLSVGLPIRNSGSCRSHLAAWGGSAAFLVCRMPCACVVIWKFSLQFFFLVFFFFFCFLFSYPAQPPLLLQTMTRYTSFG